MRMDDTSTNTSCNSSASSRIFKDKCLRLKYARYILYYLLLSSTSCKQSGSHRDASGSAYASLDSSVSYVGMNTCRQCHSGIYETYIRTGMGRSFGAASRLKSSARFTENSVVNDRYSDLSYHPFWSGDNFLLREFRMDGKDTIYSRDEKVSYIVGSGQHTNSHLRYENGYL